MAAMPIYGKNPLTFSGNHWTDFFETWHEASGTGVLQCVNKLLPLDYLDLFYDKVIRMRKIVKMSFERKNLQEMDRRYVILKRMDPQGLVCPQPWGNMYITIIFKDLLSNHLANQSQIL